MLSILINAYACAPNMGSEPGMAWNWIINLANYCQLHVITEGEWQNEIESELMLLPQANNIKFYYNPVSAKIRTMCWNQGDWRFYYYYKQWQKKALSIANDIIAKESIDIVHQLNMIGFREPGFLWELNKPFVWGPIDAKETFPIAYLNGSSLKQKLFIHLKNKLTTLQFKTSKRIMLAVKKSDIIFGASSESVQSIQKYYKKSALLLNETGCYVKDRNIVHKAESENINLLWVGKFDFRKQLGLALQIVKKLNNHLIKLHIVGDDNNPEAQKYKDECKKLAIDKQCIWYGKVSHNKVQELMQQSDLFLFTSVAEGTPHVILEAIANSLPVICFDTCGQGDTVNEKVGIKIPLSTPSKSIIDFSENINYLVNNKEKLFALSSNCKTRQQELSWSYKAGFVHNIYNEILSNE